MVSTGVELVGLRVVRGSDWIWGEQDGGEGFVGTVVRPTKYLGGTVANGCVFVIWDYGQLANYRVGHDGNHDLCVLDTSQIGSKHSGFKCYVCGNENFTGIRWNCKQCSNCNLCNLCYASDKHQLTHPFDRYDLPSSRGAPVPPRCKSSKVEAKGLYPGATVVRGPDWKWENQDGGEGRGGLICEITDKKDSPLFQDWCKVTWENAGSNEYRRGNEGALDVCCVLPSSGGYYYPTHLAKLGLDLGDGDVNPVERREVASASASASASTSASGEICVNDQVSVLLEPCIFQELQQMDHGGWNDAMAECCGQVGRVVSMMDNGDCIVQFPRFKKPLRINPVALSKQADLPVFRVGDLVKISDNEPLVISLQDNHGGWNPGMRMSLGKVGRVVHIDGSGDVQVKMENHLGIWCINPRSCTALDRKPAKASPSDGSNSSSDEESGILGIEARGGFETFRRYKEMMMHEVFNDPSKLVAAAAHGVLPHVKEILSRHPDQVDVRNCGKTALQMACIRGHVEVVECLINAGADLMARDDEGDTPMHYAVMENQFKSLEILIACGADVSAFNMNLLSPLHVAVRKGYRKCVEVLLQSHCYTTLQDNSGDTALHDAISSSNDELVELLVNADDFEFHIRNERGFNVLQLAALTGNCRAVDSILRKVPDLINVAKNDGMTPLHIAAINDRTEVVEVLINKDKVNLDATNSVGQTPLQIAILQNHLSVVELLVLIGASVNIPDDEDNTPLHVVLNLLKSEKLGAVGDAVAPKPKDAQFLAKLANDLPADLRPFQWLAVAVFLLNHKADLFKVNRRGQSPLDFVKDLPTVVELLQRVFRSTELSSECVMCSQSSTLVTFKPCGHQIVCRDCGIRMKKCFQCGTFLERIETEQESSVYCTKCRKNDRNVVLLCGHGCCDECAKTMKSCHLCQEPIKQKYILFQRNAVN